MNFVRLSLCLNLLLINLCSCAEIVADEPEQLLQLGWAEQVIVNPPNFVIDAKLDTGADNCSIHAQNVERFTQEKNPWVKFEVSNRYGGTATLKREVVRTAKVKTKKGGFQERPVVRLGVCLGDTFEMIECNLVDRSHFVYPALIGRDSLAGNAVINPSRTFTKAPNCLPTDR